MKTIIELEITHDKPHPQIAEFIAQRAWTIDGIKSVEVNHTHVIKPDLTFRERMMSAGPSRFRFGNIVP